MTMQVAQCSIFGGLLTLGADGVYHWTDTGEAEPRVRIATRGELAPSYRCITYGDGSCYVQVPHGEATDRNPRADLAWCAAYPRGRKVPGVIGDHHLVPTSDWDRWAAQPGGAIWDHEDEAGILARAAQAGRRPSLPDGGGDA